MAVLTFTSTNGQHIILRRLQNMMQDSGRKNKKAVQNGTQLMRKCWPLSLSPWPLLTDMLTVQIFIKPEETLYEHKSVTPFLLSTSL